MNATSRSYHCEAPYRVSASLNMVRWRKVMVDSRRLFPSKHVDDQVSDNEKHSNMYHFGYPITEEVMINSLA